MTAVMGEQELLTRAQNLQTEAIALWESEESGAEDFEKAERMTEEAEGLIKRSKQIRNAREKVSNIETLARQYTHEAQEVEEQRPKEFKSLGHYFKSIYHLRHNGIADARLQFHDGADGRDPVPVTSTKALAENVGAQGGFLTPTEFEARLLAVQETQSIARPRAEIIRMNRRSVRIPVLDQTDATAGTFPFFGGMSASWTEEAGDAANTEPEFRDITLTAHTLTAYTRISDHLLDDSAISLEDFLMGDKGFPGALTAHEDYAFVKGDGVGKPLGILNAGCKLTVARGTAGAVEYTDLTAMLAKALPSSGWMWMAHQSTMAQLLELSGPTGNPSYLWGNAVSGAPNTLLGYPIVFTDRNETLGTEGDIALVDWAYYLIGDRQMTTVDSSSHERFRNNQTAYRASSRVDGQPWLSTAITYVDGTTQVSPIVVLTDAAS